jgi:hypothetical protein
LEENENQKQINNLHGLFYHEEAWLHHLKEKKIHGSFQILEIGHPRKHKIHCNNENMFGNPLENIWVPFNNISMIYSFHEILF